MATADIAQAGATDGVAPRLWSRDEYWRLAELGFFDDQRVELIGGEIVELLPQGNPHVAAISRGFALLPTLFSPNFWVRCQATLDFGSLSQPDPDLAVVAGSPQSHGATVPTSAVLVVEVSDTTLRRDRGRKASLYAAAGILDYWIVNLVNFQLEVRRNPQPDATQPFGHGYATVTTHGPNEQVSPLALPNVSIAVADLLP